jgi:hypothetical protein
VRFVRLFSCSIVICTSGVVLGQLDVGPADPHKSIATALIQGGVRDAEVGQPVENVALADS